MIAAAGVTALTYCVYLFYRDVIVPQQQFKKYRQHKHRFKV